MSKRLEKNVRTTDTLLTAVYRDVQGVLYNTVRDNIVRPHRMMVEKQLRRHVTEQVEFQIFHKLYSEIYKPQIGKKQL